METQATAKLARLPRFRRASVLPAFQLTDADIEIVRQIAKHRFVRSTHVAALVGRSLDRTNDRLSKLYHHGYIDRPRAQLDYHPTGGGAPFVYALANRGARLLIDRDGVRSRERRLESQNREAGRPFIEHQLEIVDFRVALTEAVRATEGVSLILPEEIAASAPRPLPRGNPFKMDVDLVDKGVQKRFGVVPDFVFSLILANKKRRNFFVEIDRGTMPIERHDLLQTSFVRKLRYYGAAQKAGIQKKLFWWDAFRVLTLTSNAQRKQSLLKQLGLLASREHVSSGTFVFADQTCFTMTNFINAWDDCSEREARLLK